MSDLSLGSNCQRTGAICISNILNAPQGVMETSGITTNNSCIVYGINCTSPTDLPSYIDDSACLCGLLESRSSLPANGEIVELWRCIGNASSNIEDGGNGKWYNTSLPSQELSGINQPQNWAGNPPDLSQAYVLQDEDGNPTYEKLMSGNSTNLIGLDQDCTGMNDTSLSEQYYARGNGTSKSSSTSVSAAPTAKPTPKTYGTASPSTTATPPKGTKKSSAIHHFSSRSTFLMGLVIAHSFGRLF